MIKTIEQEYDQGKRGPGVARIVSCEYLGRGITAIEHFSSGHYTLYYCDGKTEVISGDKVVVHLDTKMKCEIDHRWELNDDHTAWVCANCNETAESDDIHIEPCSRCGCAVDAEQVYCEDCSF